MTNSELLDNYAAMRDGVAHDLATNPKSLEAMRLAAQQQGLPPDFHESVLGMMQDYHNRSHDQGLAPGQPN